MLALRVQIREGGSGRSQVTIELRELCSLLPRRHFDERRRIAAALRLAGFRHVIEKGEELIVLLRRDWIVAVIVTAGAPYGEAEEHGGGCVYSIHHVLGGVLLRDNATLGVQAVIAIEASGDALRKRWGRKQVAGKLLDSKLIKRYVLVERVDHQEHTV